MLDSIIFFFNRGVTQTKLMGNGVVKTPNTNNENEDVMANYNKTKVSVTFDENIPDKNVWSAKSMFFLYKKGTLISRG